MTIKKRLPLLVIITTPVDDVESRGCPCNGEGAGLCTGLWTVCAEPDIPPVMARLVVEA
jgi:hypothetical protein